MSDEYNGWANRETWALVLHIQNDAGLYMTFSELVGDRSFQNLGLAAQQDRIKGEAESLFTPAGYRDTFGGEMPAGLADVAAEIGSFWRIDWAEVHTALTEV
ncbi:DUF7249 family protein [Microbacterium trichothecenolyticum]|uniref:Uncharacterized protein n=1 Tax=Microbacterium trichothecenolyticum TaxID=69370 RepID=A0A0M2HKY5_MICTR|nr:hypothetical protein [Microbacterium trichothecenolyticum]KJL45560.1 hypothetical protein RS82_00112 [Microbacterium trichothecenolyticum]